MAKNDSDRPPMTEEELRIIDADDEVLRAECGSMSFDTTKMQQRIAGDPWQVVIQAHLYIDHIVSLMLSEHLPRPKAIALDRLGLSQKLDLLSALALIAPDLVALIRQVNRVRNHIAHDLDYDLTDERVASILARVPAGLEKHIRADPFPNEVYDLRKVLIFSVLTLDISRQHQAAERLIGQKLSLQVRRAADRIRARQVAQ